MKVLFTILKDNNGSLTTLIWALDEGTKLDFYIYHLL